MAVKNRKKQDRRAEIRSKKKRTEKQVRLARHKQLRRATARRLMVPISAVVWFNNRLVFVDNGQPIPGVPEVKKPQKAA